MPTVFGSAVCEGTIGVFIRTESYQNETHIAKPLPHSRLPASEIPKSLGLSRFVCLLDHISEIDVQCLRDSEHRFQSWVAVFMLHQADHSLRQASLLGKQGHRNSTFFTFFPQNASNVRTDSVARLVSEHTRELPKSDVDNGHYYSNSLACSRDDLAQIRTPGASRLPV